MTCQQDRLLAQVACEEPLKFGEEAGESVKASLVITFSKLFLLQVFLNVEMYANVKAIMAAGARHSSS